MWSSGRCSVNRGHNRFMRFFETAGPVRLDDHYAIPRWSGWTGRSCWA